MPTRGMRCTTLPYTALFRSCAWVTTPEVRGLRANWSLSRQPLLTVPIPPAVVRPSASVPARRTEVRPPGLDQLGAAVPRSEEHTSELQSHHELACRPLLGKK